MKEFLECSVHLTASVIISSFYYNFKENSKNSATIFLSLQDTLHATLSIIIYSLPHLLGLYLSEKLV
jgi:hypothetical protein